MVWVAQAAAEMLEVLVTALHLELLELPIQAVVAVVVKEVAEAFMQVAQVVLALSSFVTLLTAHHPLPQQATLR
jgi:hypothetical protein